MLTTRQASPEDPGSLPHRRSQNGSKDLRIWGKERREALLTGCSIPATFLKEVVCGLQSQGMPIMVPRRHPSGASLPYPQAQRPGLFSGLCSVRPTAWGSLGATLL